MLARSVSEDRAQPLITIGLTCFNAQDTIERAIRSALTQDWPRIEVVVVDDRSDDRSASLIRSAISKDSRARLVSHELNQGPAGARNTVLREAKGEVVAFFDDDDESDTSRVATQYKALVTYENRTGASLVACYASGVRRYPNGYSVDLPAIGSLGGRPPVGATVAEYLLFFRRQKGVFYGSGTPACSLMARRSTFESVGGFDPELRRVEDTEFAIRLALKDGHFIGTRERLYVQYSTSGDDKSPERNLDAELALADKHEPFLRSLGMYHYARNWPRLRYWHFKRNYPRFIWQLVALVVRHPVAVTAHLLSTGPRRILHERRMRKS